MSQGRKLISSVIWCTLIIIWIAGIIYLYSGLKEYDRAIAQQQEQQLLREEQQRREAAYQQRVMQEQNISRGVQNVVDGYKK